MFFLSSQPEHQHCKTIEKKKAKNRFLQIYYIYKNIYTTLKKKYIYTLSIASCTCSEEEKKSLKLTESFFPFKP